MKWLKKIKREHKNSKTPIWYDERKGEDVIKGLQRSGALPNDVWIGGKQYKLKK